MEEFIVINQIRLSRLDNGRHFEYHNHVYDLLHAADATKIGIPAEKITAYKADLDVEEEINRETQASLNTQRMTKKDEERDDLLSFIFNTIRTNRLSPEQAMATAAEELNVVAKPYYGIQKLGLDQESAFINGLLRDFRKTENAPHVTTLKLTSALQKLETANAEFRQIYDARSATRADNKLPQAKVARAKTDAMYEQIVFILKAAYYYGIAPVERPLIVSIVNKMNQRMEETTNAFQKSLAQKRAADKKPADPKTPKEPKQPKDPKTPDQPKEPKQPETPQPPKPGGEKPKDPKKPGDDGNPDIKLPEE